jgi:uncharacterized protein
MDSTRTAGPIPVIPRGPAEWPETLDLDALLAAGWRPTPIREFVLKIHSRCNLACDYCYMYELADQSWAGRPPRMPAAVVRQAAARIGEHARRHGLAEVTLILHGGEPLLAGPDLIGDLVAAVRSATGPRVRVAVSLQTNGIGLDERFLTLFDRLGVRVGVSIDGDAAAHDRHRRFRNGRGSSAAVLAALRLLSGERYRHLFAGVLCTVDLRNDPAATYRALLEYRPPVIDLLLPHGTWTAPPPGRLPESPATPYADWLAAVFDRWFGAPRQEVRIRLFEDIIRLLAGRPGTTETVGLSPSSVLVVETDGSIELSDMLKSAYHGAPHTGLRVSANPFDDALLLPSLAARQIGLLALAEECLTCPVHRVCGAGLYPHRYRAGNGFANPSVYCPDLFALITHIREAVGSAIGTRLAASR